jgi:hypothetical protein
MAPNFKFEEASKAATMSSFQAAVLAYPLASLLLPLVVQYMYT